MKRSLIFLGIILAVVAIVVIGFLIKDTMNPYEKPSILGCDTSVPSNEIPYFDAIDLDFEHHFEDEKSLPVGGSAVIDIDGDGVDELFIGGGSGQEDALCKFENGKFKNISTSSTLPKKDANAYPTLGVVSFDWDDDGSTDLLVCRRDGVYFYANNFGKFSSKKLDIPLNEKSAPISLTIGDIDQDGDADMFVAAYIHRDKMEGITIFNDKEYGASSLLMQREEDGSLTDITEKMGLEYVHNTFQGVFADLDNDGWLDLTVAYDTGQPRTYRNNKGKGFINIKNPYSDVYSYPMGIAMSDYNQDGNLDIFFSNTGTSIPHILAKGDLRDDQTLKTDWMLFENNGNFKFTDVAKEKKVADFEFSWGAIFEDFNMDGKQDLVVSENYISYPPHSAFPLPSRFLIQRPDGTFSAVEQQAGVMNKNFGITPLTSDFNQDGYPDLVHINIGGKSQAFINKGGNKKHLKVRFVENGKYAGSKVSLTTSEGKTMTDVYIIGEGLCADQSSTLIFALGENERPVSLKVNLPDGTEKVKKELEEGSLVTFK